MGIACSRTVAEIIPDRDVMVDIVDMIVRFEEMMKKGERSTKAQERQRRSVDKVARQMRTVVKVTEDTRVN